MPRVLYTSSRKKKSSYKRHIRVRLLLVEFIIGLLIISAIYIINHPRLQIYKINIQGSKNLKRSEVYAAVEEKLNKTWYGILLKSSYPLINKQEIEKYLSSKFIQIKSAVVKKDIYSQTLSIDIKERTIWAVFCQDNNLAKKLLPKEIFIPDLEATTSALFFGGSLPLSTTTGTTYATTINNISPQKTYLYCVYVDSDGFAYKEAPNIYGTLILKITADIQAKLGSYVIDPKLAHIMQNFKEAIYNKTKVKISEFIIAKEAAEEIRAKTTDGYSLYLNQDDQPEKIASRLKLFLDKELKGNTKSIEYIDLRFGNKIFYK